MNNVGYCKECHFTIFRDPTTGVERNFDDGKLHDCEKKGLKLIREPKVCRTCGKTVFVPNSGPEWKTQNIDCSLHACEVDQTVKAGRTRRKSG